MLGKGEEHTYKKAELKSFLQFHRNAEEPLRDDEIAILNGVLELNTKNVESIMTPLKVFLLCYLLSTLHFLMPPHLQDTVILSSDTILDHKAVEAMCASSSQRPPFAAASVCLLTANTSIVSIADTLDSLSTKQVIPWRSLGSYSSRR